MKNVLHALVPLAVLAMGFAPMPAADPDRPSTGKVLVLDNERTIEGDIERIGSQYRVRHSVGETVIPGERVLRLCADVRAAYTYLRSRANLNDPDERLRLAEWCRQHGLRDEALAEVQEAVNLRPQHAVSRRLLEHLRQSPPTAEVAAKPAAEQDVPVVPVDLTADAMGLFAARVQPILMNTCATCHAADKGGKFKLTRCYESEANNRKVIQQNLAAVLGQVNLQEPRISPLLTKAVSVHGPLAQAPLKNRQAPAYRALEEWVRLALASNPALHEQATRSSEAKTTAPMKSESPFAADAPPPAESSAAAAAPSAAPPAKPAVPDPFDPAVFNRLAHPEKPPAPPNKP
jgi:hypothetical protein